jgi:hypothetical protein
MSVSAHKMGGPPGVGALLVRRGLRLDPLLVGGDQERARRAGFENVPAIVGWGAAATTLADHLDEEEQRARAQTQRVLAAAGSLEGIDVYGDPVGRLPHLVCLGVRGIEPQAVLLGLDQAGIAVHSGSACASEDLAPSPVLEAMGVDAHHSLRISVGWSTTDDDVTPCSTPPGRPDPLRSSPTDETTRPARPTSPDRTQFEPIRPQRSCPRTLHPWSPARTLNAGALLSLTPWSRRYTDGETP